MKKFISVLLIMLMLCPNVSFAENDLKSELKMEMREGNIIIKGTPLKDGKLSRGDYYSFLVLKPGYEFESLESDEEIEDALYHMETKSNPAENKEIAFVVPFNEDAPYGVYTIKLSVLKKDGSTYVAIYRYNRASQNEINNAVNALKNAKSDNFEILLNEYVNEKLMFDVSDISEITLPAGFLGESYEIFTQGILSGKIKGNIKDIVTFDDVKYCIKGALALYSVIDNGDEKVYKKYYSLAPDFFDETIDVKETREIYKEIKDGKDTNEEKTDKVSLSMALSHIKGGTYSSVSDALEKYASVLSVDLDYLKERNITTDEVARFIDTKDVSAYKNGMGDVVKRIADDIVNQKNSGPSSRPGSSGGSGGAGSSGGSSVYPKKDTEILETVKKEPTEKFVFDDLKDLSWAKDSVMNLYEKGIVNGVSQTHFEPERKVTREEFVKMAVSAFGLKDSEKEAVEFIDCSQSDWYYPYIQIAYSNELIKGNGDGSFGAGNAIKREDAAVICLKLLEMSGKLPTIDKNKNFTDESEISDYAKSAVMSLSQIGVINGFSDGSFGPKGHTTRAQAAVIIERLMIYCFK